MFLFTRSEEWEMNKDLEKQRLFVNKLYARCSHSTARPSMADKGVQVSLSFTCCLWTSCTPGAPTPQPGPPWLTRAFRSVYPPCAVREQAVRQVLPLHSQALHGWQGCSGQSILHLLFVSKLNARCSHSTTRPSMADKGVHFSLSSTCCLWVSCTPGAPTPQPGPPWLTRVFMSVYPPPAVRE